MEPITSRKQIIIAPQIYVSLDPNPEQDSEAELKPKRTEIPMVWIQEGNNFRLDIDLPEAGALDLIFPTSVGSLYVNGETIWENNTIQAVQQKGIHLESALTGLRLTCTSSGALHVMARNVT